MELVVNVVKKKIREDTGITQTELADILETTQQQVSRWEKEARYSKLVEFFYWMMMAEPGEFKRLAIRAVEMRKLTRQAAQRREAAPKPKQKPQTTEKQVAKAPGFLG